MSRDLSSTRYVDTHGYVKVKRPGHPVAQVNGWALEHRSVMYDAGLLVDLTHHVHHLNHDKTDNRIENLEVLTPSQHAAHHGAERQTVPRWLVVSLYMLGAPTTRIAELAEINTGNAWRMLQEAGVETRPEPRTAELPEVQIAGWMDAGIPIEAIRRHLGISRAPLERIRKKFGIPPRPPGRPTRSYDHLFERGHVA